MKVRVFNRKEEMRERLLEILFTFTGTKKQGFKYYSSLTDLVNIIHAYTKIGTVHVIRDFIKEFLEEGILEYKDEHFEIKEWQDCNPFTIKRLPDYLLLTHKLEDKSLRVNYYDYRVMLYIDFHFRHKICPLFEECKKEAGVRGSSLWASEIEYSSCASIAKNTGLSLCMVRHILHKLRFYFGDRFYYKPDEIERMKREHHWSRTNTINLPPRREWKKIFEDKVKSICGDDIVLNLPKFVYYEQWAPYSKLHKRELKNNTPKYLQTRFITFLKMKDHNNSQIKKMEEGVEKWKNQKESWESYKLTIINELENMRLDGIICEMVENRIVTKLHSIRDISKMDKLLDLVVKHCDDMNRLIPALISFN